jgi:hypothetical protein
LRDIFRETLREENGKLRGHISQDKWAQIPREKFCVLISFVVVGGHTVRFRTVCTTRKEGMSFEANCWHKNRGCFECFLVAAGLY